VLRFASMHTAKVARVVAPTAADGAFLAAAWIAERARLAVFERGVFAVALAGGEGPRALYAALRARDDIDWRAWEVFVGDECAVPESDPRSVLRGVRAALLAHVPVPARQVHAAYAPGVEPDAMALAYEDTLRATLGEPAALDLVILGLGRDARVLALSPGCAAITERGRDVVALSAPPMDSPARITLTPPMVERARAVVLLAYGAAKAPAVLAVCEGPDDRSGAPGQIVRDARGEVLATLDEPAAALMPSEASND
jgi:6-phosphogluconolactonase